MVQFLMQMQEQMAGKGVLKPTFRFYVNKKAYFI